MIEEPPKLTIKKPSRRPTATQINAFQQVPTGFVVDAMDGKGALHSNIKPIGNDQKQHCAAPALTVDNRPGDILALFAALSFIQPGDFVVSAFCGYQGCAAFGDRVSGMIKNNQATAIVSDGPIRDVTGVIDVQLPVWCTGINPNSPVAQGPGSIGLPVQIGGIEVETGDMIIADIDGVVVVPFEKLDAVIERLEFIKKIETELDQEVADGLTQLPAIAELLESDQVRYVED